MSPLFRPIQLNLGSREIHIPVADLTGTSPGPTILVTGGMDGDEYAGMEAAYALAERMASMPFGGRLIVIPIVNVPGFRGECSYNPIDGYYPKFVFPGKEDGKSTERLLHWLNTNYASRAALWYDMHDGALTEGLRPFLWCEETGVPEVDDWSRSFLATAPCDTTVFTAADQASKAWSLARHGCRYVCAESGARGRRDSVDVARHVEWALLAMSSLGMIEKPGAPVPMKQTRITQVRFHMAPFDGIWRPVESIAQSVQKHGYVGTLCMHDGSEKREVLAACTGVPLWWKETMAMRKNQILCAIGEVGE